MVRKIIILGVIQLFIASCSAMISDTLEMYLTKENYKFAITGNELFNHSKADYTTDVKNVTCPEKLSLFCKANGKEANHPAICVNESFTEHRAKYYKFLDLENESNVTYSCEQASNKVNLPAEAFDIMISQNMKEAKEELSKDTGIFCVVAGSSSHEHHHENAENKDNTECSSKNKKIHYFEVDNLHEQKIKYTTQKLIMNEKLHYDLFTCGKVKEVKHAKKKYYKAQNSWYKRIGNLVIILMCALLITGVFWFLFQKDEDEIEEKNEKTNIGSNTV